MVAVGAARQEPAADDSWLDRPLAGWNDGGFVPSPEAAGGEPREAIRARCAMEAGESDALGAVEDAGWLAYHHVDRELTQDGIEIVAGMTGADAACRPTGFQIFVFVDDRFAGTLSPHAMTSGEDGAAGAVRIVGGDAITGEFARFGEADASCCPTSRVTVRYRIDRSGGRPVVAPESIRTTRGY